MSRSDFWSRRKAAVEAESAAEDRAQAEAVLAAHEAELAEQSDEDLLAGAGMPEPEMLDSAEAVQAFLKSELPKRLKTRALRRLWRLNPVLANLDGLVDYGEDFTDSATVVENLQTVYQIGKGMVARLEELGASDPDPDPESEADTDPAAEKAAVAADEVTPAPTDTTNDTANITPNDIPPDTPSNTGAPIAAPGPMPDPTADPDAIAAPITTTGRRMRFRFDTAEGLT